MSFFPKCGTIVITKEYLKRNSFPSTIEKINLVVVVLQLCLQSNSYNKMHPQLLKVNILGFKKYLHFYCIIVISKITLFLKYKKLYLKFL